MKRWTCIAGLALLALVGCSNGTRTARTDTNFTLTGVVQSVQPGDEPSMSPAPSGIVGSIKLRAVRSSSSCVKHRTATVFYTSATDLAVQTAGLRGKKVDVAGTVQGGCTLFADSVSLHVGTLGGVGSPSSGSSGSSGVRSSGSPQPVASPSPSVTHGPAPEGAIIDQTPSVAPATQK